MLFGILPAVEAAVLPAAATNNPFAEVVLDGSLLISAPVALLAGLVSFLSPCVLPLVPGYLGYVTGLSGTALQERARSRMVLGATLFVLGFSVVFVLIGAVFTYATTWLRVEGGWVTQALFGIGWAPCIGPTLSAVLLLAYGTEADATRGALLMFFYCLGLGIPFILISLGLQRGMRALDFFTRHKAAVMRVGGGMLIVVGLLMLSGIWNTWVYALQDWFANEIVMPI